MMGETALGDSRTSPIPEPSRRSRNGPVWLFSQVTQHTEGIENVPASPFSLPPHVMAAHFPS